MARRKFRPNGAIFDVAILGVMAVVGYYIYKKYFTGVSTTPIQPTPTPIAPTQISWLDNIITPIRNIIQSVPVTPTQPLFSYMEYYTNASLSPNETLTQAQFNDFYAKTGVNPKDQKYIISKPPVGMIGGGTGYRIHLSELKIPIDTNFVNYINSLKTPSGRQFFTLLNQIAI